MARALTLLVVLAGCGTLVDHEGASGVMRIGPGGGTVISPDGSRLVIAPGALDRELTVTLSPASDPGFPAAIDSSPAGTVLLRSGVVTMPLGSVAPARARIWQRLDGVWQLVPGRRLEGGGVSVPATRLAAFAVGESGEICGNGGRDDDGDGLADCEDPACAASCPTACATWDDCPCGAACVGGSCTSPDPLFCAVTTDCASMLCLEPTSHGGRCGFTACAAGTLPATNPGGLSCSADDQCTCAPCSSTSQCATGLQCQQAKRHGDPCGFDACLSGN